MTSYRGETSGKLKRGVKFLFLEPFFLSLFYLRPLRRLLGDASTVLELGAGKSSLLRAARPGLHITGVDLHEPSLAEARQHGVYDETVVSDIMHLPPEIAAKRYDVVAAFDTIEHFDKPGGAALLKLMEEHASRLVILLTPNGFVPQPPAPDNPYQEHRSGWDAAEMRALGYEVIGTGGWRALRGMYSTPIVKPGVLGALVCNVSALILDLLNLGDRSFFILCAKRVS